MLVPEQAHLHVAREKALARIRSIPELAPYEQTLIDDGGDGLDHFTWLERCDVPTLVRFARYALMPWSEFASRWAGPDDRVEP